MTDQNDTGPNRDHFESKLLPILNEGVQVVKLISFLELKGKLKNRHQGADDDTICQLAGALLNQLFCTPNNEDKHLQFARQHREAIDAELAELAETLAKLKPLLTDALRIQFLCDSQQGRQNPELLRTAKVLGILEQEREVPMPAKFIHLVRIAGRAYGVLAAD